MKVLHLTGSLSRDGGGVHSALLGLVPAVGAAGIDVALHGLVDGHWPADRADWAPLSVTAHPVRGPAVFGYAPTLLPAALAEKADLVHCHALWRYPSVVSETVSRRARLPRIVSAHGMLNAAPLAVGPWRKRIAIAAYEGRHVRGAAMVHALSDDERASVRRFGYRGPIAVIPNGVTLPPMADALSDGGRLAPPEVGPPPWQGQLADASRVLLFLGRKDPIKNLPLLLRAWARLAADGRLAPDWALVIAGWGDDAHERELKAMIDAGPIPRVVLLGPLYGDAKRRALGAAAAFVLVSRSEAMPMAALEAAAWRLPLLLTPECRLPEAGATGAAVIVDGQIDAVTEGLADLLGRDEAARAAMGRRGRDLVEAGYGWSLIADRFDNAYRWLLGGGSPPAFVET